MREIKFRGKMPTGKWIVGDLIHRNDGIAIRPFDEHAMPFGYKVDPNTVGQFTGFEDAIGQELFDGDHLMYSNVCSDEPDDYKEKEFVLRWDDDEGAFEIINADDGSNSEWLRRGDSQDYVAVEVRND